MSKTPTLVVGAAIFGGTENKHLLCACRSYPESLRGRWELPGGKLEPGETPEQALIREIREELGVAITIGKRIDRDYALSGAPSCTPDSTPGSTPSSARNGIHEHAHSNAINSANNDGFIATEQISSPALTPAIHDLPPTALSLSPVAPALTQISATVLPPNLSPTTTSPLAGLPVEALWPIFPGGYMIVFEAKLAKTETKSAGSETNLARTKANLTELTILPKLSSTAHSEVRWVPLTEIKSLPWLDGDIPIANQIATSYR